MDGAGDTGVGGEVEGHVTTDVVEWRVGEWRCLGPNRTFRRFLTLVDSPVDEWFWKTAVGKTSERCCSSMLHLLSLQQRLAETG